MFLTLLCLLNVLLRLILNSTNPHKTHTNVTQFLTTNKKSVVLHSVYFPAVTCTCNWIGLCVTELLFMIMWLSFPCMNFYLCLVAMQCYGGKKQLNCSWLDYFLHISHRKSACNHLHSCLNNNNLSGVSEIHDLLWSVDKTDMSLD